MPKGKPHSANMKAVAIASLLTGDSVSEVATRHGLNKSVVSRWKAKIPLGELQRVATKKGEKIDDAVSDCVRGNLESLTTQAKAVSDPEWIRKQSAKDLALLHGVMFDKSFRILTQCSNSRQKSTRKFSQTLRVPMI
jgi:transposase-like protein